MHKIVKFIFDVLLTVHLSIFISVINQLDVKKNLFYNKFVIFLYMFRALLCSSSGGQNRIIQHLVSSLYPVVGRPVHRLREDSDFQPVHNSQHTHITVCWEFCALSVRGLTTS